MSLYYINHRKIISIIFMLCLLIPGVSFSDNHNSEIQKDASTALTTQHTVSPTIDTSHSVKKKGILSADRDLGPFFIIGLIINLTMMTTFAFWAFGQWRQNNDKNKK